MRDQAILSHTTLHALIRLRRLEAFVTRVAASRSEHCRCLPAQLDVFQHTGVTRPGCGSMVSSFPIQLGATLAALEFRVRCAHTAIINERAAHFSGDRTRRVILSSADEKSRGFQEQSRILNGQTTAHTALVKHFNERSHAPRR
jgi:hypothetical protein